MLLILHQIVCSSHLSIWVNPSLLEKIFRSRQLAISSPPKTALLLQGLLPTSCSLIHHHHHLGHHPLDGPLFSNALRVSNYRRPKAVSVLSCLFPAATTPFWLMCCHCQLNTLNHVYTYCCLSLSSHHCPRALGL